MGTRVIDGSSPDNARDGSASSDGSGPASSAEKVYARNHCLTPRKVALGSNLMNTGRDAARGHRVVRVVNSETGLEVRRGGHDEGLRRSHGDAAGVEVGTSLRDRSCGERGNHPRPPYPPGSRSGGGQVRCQPRGCGWGGGLVVVRARERRVHGEGGQQVSSRRIGMPGGCHR